MEADDRMRPFKSPRPPTLGPALSTGPGGGSSLPEAVDKAEALMVRWRRMSNRTKDPVHKEKAAAAMRLRWRLERLAHAGQG